MTRPTGTRVCPTCRKEINNLARHLRNIHGIQPGPVGKHTGPAPAGVERPAEPARRPLPRHPDGWAPGIEWTGRVGKITGVSESRDPDWADLLRRWDFDPALYEVIEPVQVRTWDAAIGNGEVRTMWYHRAQIRRRREDGPDVDELIASIRRPRSRPEPVQDAVGAYWLALNDWQLGKRGTAAAVERIRDAIHGSRDRVKELRRLGRPIDTIVLPGLGDIGEQTVGHYGMQTFEAELNGREQARLGRQLVAYAIEQHADLAPRLLVPAIGGNHGEKRLDGQAFTDFGDNMDVEIFEGVAEAFARAPGYDHVRFLIPDNELTLTVQPIAGGPIVGLAHGHSSQKTSRGKGDVDAGPLGKIVEWWKGQQHGRRPIGDADILLVGHFHQLLVHQDGPRSLIVAPTIDSGSQWFAETAGTDSQPGMLSFLTTRTGWSDPQVL